MRPAGTLFPPRQRRLAIRLTALLRLAVRLHRNRSPATLPEIELSAERNALTMRLPREWLDAQPLTRIDLEKEALRLGPIGVEFKIGDGRKACTWSVRKPFDFNHAASVNMS